MEKTENNNGAGSNIGTDSSTEPIMNRPPVMTPRPSVSRFGAGYR